MLSPYPLCGCDAGCPSSECCILEPGTVQNYGAERDAVRFGDGLPAVFFRRSRSPWLVVMTMEDWATLYSRQKAPETTENQRFFRRKSAQKAHREMNYKKPWKT